MALAERLAFSLSANIKRVVPQRRAAIEYRRETDPFKRIGVSDKAEIVKMPVLVCDNIVKREHISDSLIRAVNQRNFSAGRETEI